MVQSWDNNDGLHIVYGADKATATTAGDYRTIGELRTAEIKIDLTTLTSSATVLANTTFFGKYRIEQVDVEVQTAATSGGSATLDVGLIKTDRSTELDYNGLVAAAAKATIDTAGKKLTLINGATAAGALIGTTTTDIGLITANYNTASFTAGVVIVRIKYRA